MQDQLVIKINEILNKNTDGYEKLFILRGILYHKDFKADLTERATHLMFTPTFAEPIMKTVMQINYKQNGEMLGLAVGIFDALKQSIAPLFKDNIAVAHLSSTEAILMKNPVSAVLRGDMETALDELLALEEIPMDCMVGYAIFGQLVCAKVDYTEGWLSFKKLHVQALFESARFDEATEALKELEGLLDDDTMEDMQNLLSSDVEKIISFISCGKALEGFRFAVEVYREMGKAEKESLYQMLEEVFVLPNRDRQHKNYAKNAKMLKNYPYLIPNGGGV